MLKILSINHFSRYVVVGVMGLFVEVVLFSFFLSMQMGILRSNFLAFHLAFGFCFILHYFYNNMNYSFDWNNFTVGFIKYATLMYILFAFGTGQLWLFIEKAGIDERLAKVLQLGINTPIAYCIQKYIIFRK